MKILHFWLLASLLWLTGCATTQSQGENPDSASDTQTSPGCLPLR